MNNFRNNRKNRFKSNGDRNFRKRSINGHKSQNGFNASSEFRIRHVNRNNQNASKLIDKYKNLAREALSSGDKILSENYLQHADHFSRILSLQETNKDINTNQSVNQETNQKIDDLKEDKISNITDEAIGND